MKFNVSKHMIRLILVAVLIGIIAGIIADSLGAIFGLVEKLFLDFKESSTNTINFFISPLRKAISVFLYL